jgi:hypothetical protein
LQRLQPPESRASRGFSRIWLQVAGCKHKKPNEKKRKRKVMQLCNQTMQLVASIRSNILIHTYLHTYNRIIFGCKMVAKWLHLVAKRLQK